MSILPGSSSRSFAWSNSGTRIFSLCMRCSIVSASVINPGTSLLEATQTRASASQNASTRIGIFGGQVFKISVLPGATNSFEKGRALHCPGLLRVSALWTRSLRGSVLCPGMLRATSGSAQLWGSDLPLYVAADAGHVRCVAVWPSSNLATLPPVAAALPPLSGKR